MNKLLTLLDYELAKSLKEKGFKPQQEWRSFYNATGLYTPDLLSQLIEACDELVEDVVFLQGHNNQWSAVDGRDGFGIYGGDGKTPEEAVARLWLALNKK